MSIPLGRYWALLVEYLKPHRRTFALLGVLLLGSIGLQLLIPQVTRYFIDTALAGGTDRAWWSLTVAPPTGARTRSSS